MYCHDVNRRSGAIWLLLMVAAFVPGCHNGKECKSCNDITPGAIPQPNGTYACQWIHAEMARADKDEFVIYQYEWAADGTKLTSTGESHVAGIAQRLPEVPFPIVIEPSPDQRVNESRRLAVLKSLADCHVQVGRDRVVLERSEAEGLYGDEAVGTSSKMLGGRNGRQGTVGTSTSLSVGGTTASSSSGSSIGIGINSN